MQSDIDIENQLVEAELELEAHDPLLPKGERTVARYFRASREAVQLDDIPPIIKSANGNIFWADEQCTRRVGLTSTEARLFLRLLQVEEPENYNYDEYKSMFDDFGKEQKNLEALVKALPWWSLETYHQKPIWKARIEWLERMKEPRLWLLYLMARRRRILKQATMRVLDRFKEKSEWRRRSRANLERPEPPTNVLDRILNNGVARPVMANDASQTPETHLNGGAAKPAMINDACQTSERHLSLPEARASSKPRSSFSSRHRDNHHSRRDSHSHSSGHCPVFDRPFEATRQGIKHQVELLMPKPTPYIVIGWFLRSASDPKERILEFEKPEHLFKILRHGESDVRGWRRFLSLKSLKGFGLYKVSHWLLTLVRCLLSAVRYCQRCPFTSGLESPPESHHVAILPGIQGLVPAF
jgi:hypothetical protein